MRLIMATSYKENGCLPRVVAWWGRECFPLNPQMAQKVIGGLVPDERADERRQG
jgi:hypothetical protein